MIRMWICSLLVPFIPLLTCAFCLALFYHDHCKKPLFVTWGSWLTTWVWILVLVPFPACLGGHSVLFTNCLLWRAAPLGDLCVALSRVTVEAAPVVVLRGHPLLSPFSRSFMLYLIQITNSFQRGPDVIFTCGATTAIMYPINMSGC